jgi:energy-coupling factor transporter ATP-binding protein EcfA2
MEPGIGLAVQLPEEGFCAPTVTEEIAVGMRGRGLDARALREKVERSLEMVGLDCKDIGMRSPLSLSEGEKKKVAIASAIASEGALLLLDEPTQGLDGLSAGLVLKAVRSELDRGATAVVVSHDWDFLLCVADRMIALRDGGVAESASRRGVLLGEGPSELLPGGQLAAMARWAGCWPERSYLDTLEDAAERLSERIAAALGLRLSSVAWLRSR